MSSPRNLTFVGRGNQNIPVRVTEIGLPDTTQTLTVRLELLTDAKGTSSMLFSEPIPGLSFQLNYLSVCNYLVQLVARLAISGVQSEFCFWVFSTSSTPIWWNTGTILPNEELFLKRGTTITMKIECKSDGAWLRPVTFRMDFENNNAGVKNSWEISAEGLGLPDGEIIAISPISNFYCAVVGFGPHSFLTVAPEFRANLLYAGLTDTAHCYLPSTPLGKRVK